MRIGIIGGSGFDQPNILNELKRLKVHTPYGRLSGFVATGKIEGVDCVVLSRHGDMHSILPSDVNFRANIYALKELGVTHILATTACGSLKEDIKPGDFVFIDQFIDMTKKRPQTFYEGQDVCHIPMAKPFCDYLSELLIENAVKLGLRHHSKGTVVTIEGPRFSSRAESNLFRAWGCDVINMTTVPECVLAREAGIHYASIAMATDYDCWRIDEESVTAEMVSKIMKENVANVKKLIFNVIPLIKDINCKSHCVDSVKWSIM
ncbi:MAG TPA: S-methyl-5'-thioadenosine phosphorylase [Candidatus Woesearchaeota archaeon]|nr:S-methyl-5'-thioadenosine phosphorylase [Candidatus Woesearchaeota archaeon]